MTRTSIALIHYDFVIEETFGVALKCNHHRRYQAFAYISTCMSAKHVKSHPNKTYLIAIWLSYESNQPQTALGSNYDSERYYGRSRNCWSTPAVNLLCIRFYLPFQSVPFYFYAISPTLSPSIHPLLLLSILFYPLLCYGLFCMLFIPFYLPFILFYLLSPR